MLPWQRFLLPDRLLAIGPAMAIIMDPYTTGLGLHLHRPVAPEDLAVRVTGAAKAAEVVAVVTQAVLGAVAARVVSEATGCSEEKVAPVVPEAMLPVVVSAAAAVEEESESMD